MQIIVLQNSNLIEIFFPKKHKILFTFFYFFTINLKLRKYLAFIGFIFMENQNNNEKNFQNESFGMIFFFLLFFSKKKKTFVYLFHTFKIVMLGQNNNKEVVNLENLSNFFFFFKIGFFFFVFCSYLTCIFVI